MVMELTSCKCGGNCRCNVPRFTFDDTIVRDHEYRLDVATYVPLKRRGKRYKRRPRTAIISLVTQEAIKERLDSDLGLVW